MACCSSPLINGSHAHVVRVGYYLLICVGGLLTCDAKGAEITSQVEIADRMRTIYRLSTMGRRFQDVVAPAAYGDASKEPTWREVVAGTVMYPTDEEVIPAAGATRSELEVISLFSLERNVATMVAKDAKAKVQAVVGPGTYFEITSKNPSKLPSPARIKSDDPLANVILFVEVYERKANWQEQRDFVVPGADEELSDEQFHSLGNAPASFHVTFADGEVWHIRRDVPKDVMTGFFYVAEAKQIDRETQLGNYMLDRISSQKTEAVTRPIPPHLLLHREQ